jgi:molecular chaperone DnaK (HSP70)
MFTGQVNKAVIAVPAKFSPEQRAATGEAFKAAGLKVPLQDRLLP